MKKYLSIPVLCLSLAGCGLVIQGEARNQMLASKAAYKECLTAHPQSTAACAGLKAAYKADLEAYKQESPNSAQEYDVNINHSSD